VAAAWLKGSLTAAGTAESTVAEVRGRKTAAGSRQKISSKSYPPTGSGKEQAAGK
jgi:hypothetical protein